MPPHHIFPIGFGIVDRKNDQSWICFSDKLMSVVPDSEELVFVSDRHTVIYSGIKWVSNENYAII